MSHILYYLLILLAVVYATLLFYFMRGLYRVHKQARSVQQPFISVIVCARNEQRNLPGCISALAGQSYPQDKIEFILMDDRSTDDSAQIMEQICRQDTRFRTYSLTDRVAGFAPKKRAIDFAISKTNSASELILLTDADGRPGPEWATSMVSFFTPDTDMVLGYAPYTVVPAGHRTKKILALEYLSHAAISAATCGLGFPVTCVGTNMAYRKKLYLEVGGFGPFKNQISGDDDLFLTHVREQHRYRIGYAADAKAQVFNAPPKLWFKFIHQRMRYASKGFKYPLKVTAALVTYYGFNLLFLLLSGLLIWLPDSADLFALALVIKCLPEYLFMRRAGKLLGDTRHLHMFIPATLMHIPYVVIFGFLGQLDYFKWAEAGAETGVVAETELG